jgi:beta-N-acetylhexosaminidase
MKTLQFFSFFLVILSFLNAVPAKAVFAQPKSSANRFVEPSEKAAKWAEKNLKKMSLEERVGQLISIGVNARFMNDDSQEFQELRRQVLQNKIGGIILFGSPVYDAVRLTNRLQTVAPLPLLMSADFEAGTGMRFEATVNFPWNMALGATGDPALARRQGEITAKEARALGVHQVFAPVVDVNNNAANPVINVRSYGENPETVARFANAFVEGLQANGALATAKHFPGHGDTAVDSHRGLPVINLPRARFESVELVPFKSVVNNNIGSIMIAHIGLPQFDNTQIAPLKNAFKPVYAEGEVLTENATIPATLSPAVGEGLLRKDLNFRGLIVTDAMDMSGLTLYFNQDEAAARAVIAGADMILKPADPDASIRGILAAVKSGRITQERINQSARKILTVKYELGLTKNRLASFEEIERVVASKEARDLADEIANKAITLVRNDAGLLPLKQKRVFILAVTNGDDRFFVANHFLRQLRQGGLNFEVVVLDERSSESEISAAIEQAKKAEIVVAPLYGRVRTGAKNSVGLPENASKALREVLTRNQNVVGISFGNPYLLGDFPALKTYAVAYGEMPSLQRAAARAVLGQQDIAGKLPISLPNLAPIGTGIQIKKQSNSTAAINR